MLIYVVIGIFQGVVSEVKGFLDPGEAQNEYDRLVEEYGIKPGEESEHGVQLHEVGVEARPASVLARRIKW
jgi:hypothetical protein